jgi:hypothetical protein
MNKEEVPGFLPSAVEAAPPEVKRVAQARGRGAARRHGRTG